MIEIALNVAVRYGICLWLLYLLTGEAHFTASFLATLLYLGVENR